LHWNTLQYLTNSLIFTFSLESLFTCNKSSSRKIWKKGATWKTYT